ncbi:MAG: phosphate ABC transporter permease, partial [Kiritimatiellae bacterium]|nr:phosphate ABC transporter permease [Kiritimatiellia bacterium]
MSGAFPSGADQYRQVARRQRAGLIWQMLFQSSTIVAIVALSALLYNVLNGSFGLVAIKNQVDPASIQLDGVDYPEMSGPLLIQVLEQHLSKGLIRRFNHEQPLVERTDTELRALIEERVIKPTILETWMLMESITHGKQIRAEWQEKDPDAVIQFRAWVNLNFLTASQSSDPQKAGIRTAIIGSLMTIVITILFAFPIGVGAAIYL